MVDDLTALSHRCSCANVRNEANSEYSVKTPRRIISPGKGNLERGHSEYFDIGGIYNYKDSILLKITPILCWIAVVFFMWEFFYYELWVQGYSTIFSPLSPCVFYCFKGVHTVARLFIFHSIVLHRNRLFVSSNGRVLSLCDSLYAMYRYRGLKPIPSPPPNVGTSLPTSPEYKSDLVSHHLVWLKAHFLYFACLYVDANVGECSDKFCMCVRWWWW